MKWTRLAVLVLVLALLCAGLPVQPALAQTAGSQTTDEDQPTSIGVVQTEYGKMVGVRGDTEGVTLFKGIPYAAPPVGDLRWAPPQDPESWDGVRVLDTYGDACMMYTFDGDMSAEPWKSDFYYVELPKLSEDCLYLNVATNAVKGDEQKPVYVWFHGGGLRHGYSSEVEFDPNVLASKDVIVVTVGQRLGVFGYMALPQLSEESGYNGSGNYGLMDEIKAMEWVKNNIAAFGGDPNNITVGGQSGGTTKSAALFVAEQSRDMAQRAIWESGLKWTGKFAALADAEKQGVTWLQHLGLTGNESLQELRAMDAKLFLGRIYADYSSMAPAGMNVDGEYIKVGSYQEAWDAGALEGVDILSGTNLGEATYDSEISNAEQFRASYREMLGDLYDEYDVDNLISVVNANANDMARTLASYGFAATESRNLTLAELFGAWHDANTEDGDVYVYLFSHRAPGRNEETMWAWHSSEMWYTFASLRDIPEQREWEDWDYELADIMSSYWANFITTGDPNGEGLPTWAPSNSDSLSYMEFGDELYPDTTISKLDQLMIDYAKAKFAVGE